MKLTRYKDTISTTWCLQSIIYMASIKELHLNQCHSEVCTFLSILDRGTHIVTKVAFDTNKAEANSKCYFNLIRQVMDHLDAFIVYDNNQNMLQKEPSPLASENHVLPSFDRQGFQQEEQGSGNVDDNSPTDTASLKHYSGSVPLDQCVPVQKSRCELLASCFYESLGRRLLVFSNHAKQILNTTITSYIFCSPHIHHGVTLQTCYNLNIDQVSDIGQLEKNKGCSKLRIVLEQLGEYGGQTSGYTDISQLDEFSTAHQEHIKGTHSLNYSTQANNCNSEAMFVTVSIPQEEDTDRNDNSSNVSDSHIPIISRFQLEWLIHKVGKMDLKQCVKQKGTSLCDPKSEKLSLCPENHGKKSAKTSKFNCHHLTDSPKAGSYCSGGQMELSSHCNLWTISGVTELCYQLSASIDSPCLNFLKSHVNRHEEDVKHNIEVVQGATAVVKESTAEPKHTVSENVIDACSEVTFLNSCTCQRSGKVKCERIYENVRSSSIAYSHEQTTNLKFLLKTVDSLWQILIQIVLVYVLHLSRTSRCIFAKCLILILSVSCFASPSCASTTFNIIPSSQVVSVGEEAVFKCHHPTADIIDWIVNGSLVGRNPPPDVHPSTFQTDNGTTVDTLTIVGRPEYNGTVVVCEAFFRDGPRSELSTEALLVLTELTVPPPPVGEFVLPPVDQIVAQRQQAVFNCQHSTARAISWKLNGSFLLDTSLVGVEARSTSLPGGVRNTLRVKALPQYNLTIIECVAAFLDGSSPEITETVTLIIQGPPDAVTNLASTRDPFLIAWEPPFSLNLTDVEPDIVYCIEISAILNCREAVSIVNDCNVNTNYYNAESLNPGYIYNITVTPRSNGNSSLSGILSVLDEEYTPFPNSSVSVNNISLDYQDFSINIQFNVTVKVQPATYTLSLEAIDGEPDPESFSSLPVTKVVEDKGGVTLKTTLPRRRLWLCTVFPDNCTDGDQAISDAEDLSTHDIQNVSVLSYDQTSEVQVFGDFVAGTSATGALIIIYSNELTHYHLAPRGGNGKLDTTVPNLPGGAYKVSVFTVEENGLPFERVVARPIAVNITATNDNSGLQSTPHIIEYELSSITNPDGVNVTCFFLEESTTDCVVVIHSAKSTLNSNGLMNITSYLFKRPVGNDSISGYIEGVNLKDYHFGIIGGEQRREEKQTNESSNYLSVYIVGTMFFLSIMVFIAILFVVIVMKRQHRSRFRDYVRSVENVEHKENIYYTQVELKNTREASHSSGAHQANSDEERVYDELTSPHTVTVQESALDVIASVQHETSQYASIACATSGYKLDTHQADKGKVQDDTKVIYSDIRPDEKNEHCHMEPVQVSSREEDRSKESVPVQMPFTVDNLFDQLWPLHDKWQKLGDVMSLSEDLLDEIDTNNEDDESCLRDLFDFYLKKWDTKHTWDEIHSFVKAVDDENLADKIYRNHIQPFTHSKAEHCQAQVHGPLKLQNDDVTWSSAVERAECCQQQSQQCGTLKPKDAVEEDITEVSASVSPSEPPESQVHGPFKQKDDSKIEKGVYQFKIECQPQSPSCSALTVDVCDHTTDATSTTTDHVTLREKKDKPVGFQTSYTPHRYRSWPASVANSPYNYSVARVSSPDEPRKDTNSESVNYRRQHDHILHNTNVNNKSQSRASAPFIFSQGALQSPKKVDQPLTQSLGCITVEGCNVNDTRRAVTVSCTAMQTLGFDDSKEEPKVDVCSESKVNDDRSQLPLNNCVNF